MKFHESHFWYNKSQRNGVLFLTALLTLVQVILYFTDEFFDSGEKTLNPEKLQRIERELDSLQQVNSRNKTFRIYPFNPNFISDYKGYLLGMTPEEIDRLLEFREKDKFVNSKREFQEVTQVSDSLLNEISMYFKFPRFTDSLVKYSPSSAIKNQVWEGKKDLNTASLEEFIQIKGIGPVLGKRIIGYRKLLGGFSFEDQLYEVYNLPEEVIEILLSQFEIGTPPQIKQLNVNTATFEQILKLPYIDYELTRKIMAFRSEEKIITDLSDLKKIDSFPLEKYDRIAVYLLAE